MSNGNPPLSAVLIALAAVVFGLAQTLPGLKIEGRTANALLIAVIAIPCLAVAALAK